MPATVFLDLRKVAPLPGNLTKLIVAVASYMNRNAEAWPALTTLAKDTATTLATACRWTKEAAKAGHLIIEKRLTAGGRSRNVYRIAEHLLVRREARSAAPDQRQPQLDIPAPPPRQMESIDSALPESSDSTQHGIKPNKELSQRNLEGESSNSRAPSEDVKGKAFALTAGFTVPREWLEDGRQARERAGLEPAKLRAEAVRFVMKRAAARVRRTAEEWHFDFMGWCLNANAQIGTDAPAKPSDPARTYLIWCKQLLHGNPWRGAEPPPSLEEAQRIVREAA